MIAVLACSNESPSHYYISNIVIFLLIHFILPIVYYGRQVGRCVTVVLADHVYYVYWKYAVMLLVQTNLPVFRVKESSVRRRYSDFEWLRGELERDSKVCLSICLCVSLSV